ncbi:hypothetical protein BDV93DRAFT_542226 [Ceratobasidium sp. AG-I]|nr:hypothetical protein BDV93DRAFT_542226 [Ceratobasidium sp. AG-I]
MGKVTVYCQISGCTPEVERIVDIEHIERNSEYEYGPKVTAALELLVTEDEAEGQQALSIIGALNENDSALWAATTDNPTVEQALALPKSFVRVLRGCSMGDMFSLGFCDGPVGRSGALVSFGCCFYVLTNVLPILEAATGGRVSPRRLWDLVVSRGYLDAHSACALPGVDYGPITDYQEQFPWLFGTLTTEAISSLEELGTPDDIADVLRDKGFWMWMRPDRFPVDSPTQTPSFFAVVRPTKIIPNTSITKLPSELLHSIALHLPLSSVVSLARLNKTTYYHLIGGLEARDTLARAYMRTQARWCLPFGEAECRWWDDRDGDDALGWGYLKRCWSESYSMRNRRRVWRAAEAIEEECDQEEVKRASESA